MEYPLLKDVKYERELIHTWPFIQVGHSREHRLYYKVDEDSGTGFDFYSVMWAGCSGEHDKDIWNLESVAVECGFCGNARFDGIRHLYMGHEDTDNYGYHYYAKLPDLIEVLQALRKLEEMHCWDHDK